MPLFNYKAEDVDGRVYTDTLQASNKSNAVSTLKSQGINVLTIKKSGGINNIMFGGSGFSGGVSGGGFGGGGGGSW